jgi:hypothetical protein
MPRRHVMQPIPMLAMTLALMLSWCPESAHDSDIQDPTVCGGQADGLRDAGMKLEHGVDTDAVSSA